MSYTEWDVKFNGKKYTIIQEPVIAGTPLEELETFFEAKARDEEGNEFTITWEASEEYLASRELSELLHAEHRTREEIDRTIELVNNNVNHMFWEDDWTSCDWDDVLEVNPL
jgi:hypothetical protein